MELDNDDGGTLLTEEEKEGLLIAGIITRTQLDEHEQSNIEEALQWLIIKSFSPEIILSEKFIKALHKRMYSKVWRWAGKFRTTNKNLGIEWFKVPLELKQLIDDSLYWVKNNVYEPDEMAIRFKHRLVSIHCFPNGNGRHSRLMADIIIEKIYTQPIFSWGATNLTKQGEARTAYIQALKAADLDDYGLLLVFARS